MVLAVRSPQGEAAGNDPGGTMSQQAFRARAHEITARALENTDDAEPDDPLFPRTLYQYDKNGSRDEAQPEIPLCQPVTAYLSSISGGAQLGFRCLSISGARHDGITSARRKVEESIRRMREAEPPQLVTLQGDPAEGGLPNLFSIVSRRNVIRAARKAGAPGIPRPFQAWITAAIIMGAVAITATLSLLTPLGGGQGRGAASLVHPLSLLSVFGIAALGVLAQLLINMPWRDKHRLPPEQKVADWLADQHGQTYKDFIDSLTRNFARFSGFRCLVVDEFSFLDRPTQDVLTHYLSYWPTDSNWEPEFWILFDSFDEPGLGEFAKTIVSLRTRERLKENFGDGINRVKFFELAPLSRDQRYTLAQQVGKPERAGYRTIKAIVAESEDTLPDYFGEQIPSAAPRQDPGRYAAFQLLYLLSLATASGPYFDWPERALLRRLAEQRQRSRVLREILTIPDPSRSGPSRTDLATRLERMRKDFVRVVTTLPRGPDLHVAVSPEVGEVLGRLSGRFELADAKLGHLFWALYRHDTRAAAADDPFWLGKATHHLLLAASPHDYSDRFGPDTQKLMDRLFLAILDAVGDSVRLSQLALVPRLLQRAADLLEDDDQNKRAALLRRARDAYAVLADDTILRILVDLRSAEEPRRSGALTPAAPAPAVELFVQATVGAAHLSSTRSVFDPGHSLAALRGDAELRGSWLALSLEPFVSPERQQFLAAIDHARLTVPAVAKAVLSARTDDPENLDVADLVNVSIGLWCWALAGEAEGAPDKNAANSQADISDKLETAYYLALSLRDKYVGDNLQNEQPSKIDLVREGLTEELLTVTAATALLVKQTWSGLRERNAEETTTILNAALAELGLPVLEQESSEASYEETLNALADRMSLLQVTWAALGYEQLATILNIRRIQFTAGLIPATMTTSRARAVARGMVEDRDQPDLLGLLTNLAVASQALPSYEGAAEALVYGVTASLSGEMDEKFSIQLCWLAISYAHSYASNLERIVQFLLEASDVNPGESRLDRLLSWMAYEQLDTVSLQLLNVARAMKEEGIHVETALRRRAEGVPDEEIRYRLEENFSVHELVRRQTASKSVDVDEVLDFWADHRESSSYPFVLYRLIPDRATPLPSRLRKAIARALDAFTSYLDENGICLLAGELATRSSLQARKGDSSPQEFDKDLIVGILRELMPKWSIRLSAETNINILEFLNTHDAAHTYDYESWLGFWREEKIRLLGERDLPHWISAGRYVLVMMAYLETLSVYGMPVSEGADTSTDTSDNIDLKTERAMLSKAAEQAFFTINNKLVLNRQFLRGAQKLFLSPASKDRQYDDVRYDFNNAAKEAMSQFFTFLQEVDGIPASIRSILQKHEIMVRQRLSSLTRGDPSLR